LVFPLFTINTIERKEEKMSLTEKTAYLKGLADGLEYDKTTKEGKLLAALIDLVDELANEVADIQNDIEEIDNDLDYLSDYVEELDDDLQVVEDFLDDECELEDEEDEDNDWDEDEEDDEDWEECDGDCTSCDGCSCEDEEYYEIVCPSCGETVCFDGELDPENLICPACGEKFGCIVEEDDYKKLTDEE
jgi:hypothetical protein